MQENQQLIDYKNTLNLPKTDFPMKGDGPRREPEIQKFWFQNNIYQKVLESRRIVNRGSFLLHDGPPYLSSGNIHIGTALNKILKDIVVKYKTLNGFYSPYVPGFDCHGLPIESAIQRLEVRGQRSEDGKQKKLTSLEVRKECTEFVLKNKKSQEEKFKRLGVLGDWEHAYMTLDPKFEAAQLKLFGEMVNKGYIYRGLKPVFWCTTCQTALAEAEVEYVENHKSVSIYVSFQVIKFSNSAKKLGKFKDLKVVIWTTTPWTIPGNMAVCLNKDFEYVVIKSQKFGYLLLAKALLNEFNKKVSEECKILEILNGKELEGTVCKHPFYERESPIILGDHVTLETGTGCVHTAPGHGLEDFVVAQKYGIKVISPVDSKGLLTEEAGENLKGLYAHKSGNQKVIELLSSVRALVHQEDYFHSYPHCWRSKTPIIFRATEQWFCSIEPFRNLALSEINKVRWIPAIGKNRIYSMVESRTDWCISRQRIWGVPIPAFYCSNCNKEHLNKIIIEHIAKLVEKKGTNIWWEEENSKLLLNNYTCTCGSNVFEKEKDIMDVWFDSGSTHYSVVNNREDLKNIKDVLYLEGSDQHRGWFQSSLLTSVAISKKAPYTDVITHGFVLDESGRKMSKSLGNVVDPEKVISEYGADILRLWVSSIDYTSDMRIGKTMLSHLAEVYRNIRNTARFLLSNLHDYTHIIKSDFPMEKLWNIDRYILSNLEKLKLTVTEYFDKYEFYMYYQLIQNFCAVDLSGFYFDVVKDRLYTAGKNSNSRRAVQFVLSEVLDFLIKILCPVLPHLAEDIWKHLPNELYTDRAESVLFLDWARLNQNFISDQLEIEFKNILLVKELVNKALEELRTRKIIGKSLEANVEICFSPSNSKSKELYDMLKKYENELPAIYIVSEVKLLLSALDHDLKNYPSNEYSNVSNDLCNVIAIKSTGEKCLRCWKYSSEIGKDSKHKMLCTQCVKAVEGLD